MCRTSEVLAQSGISEVCATYAPWGGQISSARHFDHCYARKRQDHDAHQSRQTARYRRRLSALGTSPSGSRTGSGNEPCRVGFGRGGIGRNETSRTTLTHFLWQPRFDAGTVPDTSDRVQCGLSCWKDRRLSHEITKCVAVACFVSAGVRHDSWCREAATRS
jgi:hypothetical protein